MANASHKHAGSYLSVESTMWAAELLSLSETVAAELYKRDGKSGPIVLTDKSDSQLDFAVVLRKRPVMRFRVHVHLDDDGQSVLRSHITACATEQHKLLMIIPSEEKKLLGWNTYHTFMQTLEGVVQERDPKARISLQLEAG